MKKKYEIVFFPDSLTRGGAERVTVYLSEYFASKGKSVAIITTNEKREGEYETPNNVDRICVGYNNKNIIKLVIGYMSILRKYEIDAGIIMGLPQCSYIIPATIFNKIKVIVSERNSPANFNGRKITKLLMTFFMKFADGYVFQTNDARNYYKKKLKGKSIVIANPIDTSLIPSRDNKTNLENIISVGRLAPQKNQQLLIRCFKMVLNLYPKSTLTIYGEGESRKDLEQLINELSLNNNVFLPGIKENILDIESKSGLFVFTSDFEGIPNALLEAMAIGLPCISTDCPCGGPASVIKNKENGLLVPTNNLEALFNAMIYMLDNKNHAYAMGDLAKNIKEDLNISKIGDQWLKFVQDRVK